MVYDMKITEVGAYKLDSSSFHSKFNKSIKWVLFNNWVLLCSHYTFTGVVVVLIERLEYIQVDVVQYISDLIDNNTHPATLLNLIKDWSTLDILSISLRTRI